MSAYILGAIGYTNEIQLKDVIGGNKRQVTNSGGSVMNEHPKIESHQLLRKGSRSRRWIILIVVLSLALILALMLSLWNLVKWGMVDSVLTAIHATITN